MSDRLRLDGQYDVLQSAKDRINTIYFGLGDPPYSFDWEAASLEIEMSPGCVAVEMETPYTHYGTLEVSQIAAGRMRSDCGTVLAVGGPRLVGKYRIEDPSQELCPGDRVALLPYDGKHFITFAWGTYASLQRVNVSEARLERSKVRMIGVASLHEDEQVYKDWWEVVLAKIQKEVCAGSIVSVKQNSHEWLKPYWGKSGIVKAIAQESSQLDLSVSPTCDVSFRLDGTDSLVNIPGDSLELHAVQPLKRWVLIRRKAVRFTQGNVHLPDSSRYREQVAQVVAVGPQCERSRVGDWVVYQGKALVIDFEFGERFGFEGDPKDYVMIHETDLHCRLRNPSAA